MNNKRKNKVFMAFASGRETKEVEFKRLIGVGSVFVLGVNPTKEELEKIYATTLDNEPQYLGKTEIGTDENKQEVDQIRLDFIIKTDPEKNNGIESISKVSLFMANSPRYNSTGEKVQVINKYGETAWLTIEDVKNKTLPENMKWFSTEGMRPAFIGEESLIAFIKAYLGIPNPAYKDKKTGKVIELKDKSEAEAYLDNISKYFKGDISEVKQALAIQPNNKIKVLFGVKTTDDNKQYQDVFTRKFLKNGVTNYSYLDAEVKQAQDAGAYPNTEFEVVDLKEYGVEATDFGKDQGNDLPFSEGKSPWG